MDNDVCPQCKNKNNNEQSKLVQSSCGHWKCQICSLKNDSCSLCLRSVSVIKELPKQCDPPVTVNQFPRHISILNGNPIIYKCTICCKTFKSKSNCCYHKHCANGMEKPYSCSVCGRKFSTKTHHTYHCLMHTGVNPFKCLQCNKSFKTKNKLGRHQEVHLEKRKNYSCDVCGRLFLRKTSIKVHKRSHTGEKPYHCSQCPKAFSEKKNLIHHISSHTRIKNWVCEICGNSFAVKWNLELHKRTHTRVRPFTCPVSECQLSFSQNRYLKRHMETHKSSIKYVCSICEKVFSRKDNLQRHIGNTHLEHQLNTNKTKETRTVQKQIDTNVSLNSESTVEQKNTCINDCIRECDKRNEKSNENVFVESEINASVIERKSSEENTAKVVGEKLRIVDEAKEKGVENCAQEISNSKVLQRETVIKNWNNRISVIKKVNKQHVINLESVNQNINDNILLEEIPDNLSYESGSFKYPQKNVDTEIHHRDAESFNLCTTDSICCSSKTAVADDDSVLFVKCSNQMNDAEYINYNTVNNVFPENHQCDIHTEEKCLRKTSNSEVLKFQCFLPKKIITASYKECACSTCVYLVSLNDQNNEKNSLRSDIQNSDGFLSKKYYDSNNLLDLSMKGQE